MQEKVNNKYKEGSILPNKLKLFIWSQLFQLKHLFFWILIEHLSILSFRQIKSEFFVQIDDNSLTQTYKMLKIENSSIKKGKLLLSNIFAKDPQQIGDEGVEQICSLDTHSISQLSLSLNNISPRGIATICAAKWHSLRNLDLSINRIGNSGCKYLSMITLDNLIGVRLSFNQIGSAGILHLCKSQWINIRSIHLDCNLLSVDGVKHLVSGNWNKGPKIYVSKCQLTFHDTLHLILVQSPRRTLFDFDENQIEPEELEKLRHFIEHKS